MHPNEMTLILQYGKPKRIMELETHQDGVKKNCINYPN